MNIDIKIIKKHDSIRESNVVSGKLKQEEMYVMDEVNVGFRIGLNKFGNQQLIEERFLDGTILDDICQKRNIPNMPSLECEKGYQDGIHRALAAKKIGVEKIPVLLFKQIKTK